MSNKDTTQRSYMALAPISSLAGIFINPLASTITPLILYFIFKKTRAKVAKVALQTADLAFSMQLWIMLISLSLMLGISLNWVAPAETQKMMEIATSIILVIFFSSLVFAIYQALNGRTCTHMFSFKIAERVFSLISNKPDAKNDSTKEK